MFLLLFALQARLLSAKLYGSSDGTCPSERYHQDLPVEEDKDCYFPNEGTKDIVRMFCVDKMQTPTFSIHLQPDFDQEFNPWCPHAGGEQGYDDVRCRTCWNWSYGVGCAKIRGGGHKYNRFRKDVPINFVAKWQNLVKMPEDFDCQSSPPCFSSVVSDNFQPVRAWVGCEYFNDEKVNAIEISIQAPNPTCLRMMDDKEYSKKVRIGKYLPHSFLDDIAKINTLEKLTISASLAGIRYNPDHGPELPPFTGLSTDPADEDYGLKELNISENSFGEGDGWPMWNFWHGTSGWKKLLKLDMSSNGLKNPYPNELAPTRDDTEVEEWKGAERAIWARMTSLTHLNLSNNMLTQITPCTFGCIVPGTNEDHFKELLTPNLKHLDLSNNELDGDAFTMVHRRSFTINGEDVDLRLKSEDVFKGLGKLKVINLSNNKMDYLPPKLFARRSLKNLMSIDLRGNPLKCLPLLPEGLPRDPEWNSNGPFFWDGGDLPTCSGGDPRDRDGRRLVAAMESFVDVQKLWFAVPAVVVFAGIAIALSKPYKSEVYDTLA